MRPLGQTAPQTAVAILGQLGVPVPSDSLLGAFERLAGIERSAWQAYANLTVLGTMGGVSAEDVATYERTRTNLLIAENSLRLEAQAVLGALNIPVTLEQPTALPPYTGPVRAAGTSGLGAAPAAAAGALASPVSWGMVALLAILAAIAAAAVVGITVYAIYATRETVARIILASLDAIEESRMTEARLNCLGACMGSATSDTARQQCIDGCMRAVPQQERRVTPVGSGDAAISAGTIALGVVALGVVGLGGYALYRHYGSRSAISKGTSGAPRSLETARGALTGGW